MMRSSLSICESFIHHEKIFIATGVEEEEVEDEEEEEEEEEDEDEEDKQGPSSRRLPSKTIPKDPFPRLFSRWPSAQVQKS